MATATMNNETDTISFDQMKTQINRALEELAFKSNTFVSEPYIGFEKGFTKISCFYSGAIACTHHTVFGHH